WAVSIPAECRARALWSDPPRSAPPCSQEMAARRQCRPRPKASDSPLTSSPGGRFTHALERDLVTVGVAGVDRVLGQPVGFSAEPANTLHAAEEARQVLCLYTLQLGRR